MSATQNKTDKKTTKKEANASTALTTVPPLPSVDTITPLPNWKDEADRAFKAISMGAKSTISGEQRLAYAIMVFCAHLKNTKVTGYTLADIMKPIPGQPSPNTTVMNYLRKKCVSEFNVTNVTKKAKNVMSVPDREKAIDKSVERSPTAFGRSFTLAYTFANNGVTYAQFSKELGVFCVRPRLLVENDAAEDGIKLYGRLVTDSLVPIDGKAIYYTTQDNPTDVMPHDVFASLAHYKRCNGQVPRSRSVQGEAKPDAVNKQEGDEAVETIVKTEISRMPVEKLADLMSLEKAIAIVKVLFCDTAKGPISYRVQHPIKAWNDLFVVSHRVQQSRADKDFEIDPDKLEVIELAAERKATAAAKAAAKRNAAA